MKKYYKRRYQFFLWFNKILLRPFLLKRFKPLNKYHINKNEPVLVLGNHQTDLDPLYIHYSFNRILCPVATDTLMANGFVSKFLKFAFGVISKKKGTSDSSTTLNIGRVLKENGCVVLFPEGNRTIAEFQFYINPKLASFIKKFKPILILYRLSGGTGVSPRFAKSKRSGKFTGSIERVLKPSDYQDLTDEELMKIIKDTIKSYDSKTDETYIAKDSAEYLERLFFICPKCHKMHTLKSSGEYITCTSCNLKVRYNEHLHLESDESTFSFSILNDWYQYQKQVIKESDFKGLIFEDYDISLFLCKPYKKRKKIAHGTLKLTDEAVFIDNYEIKLNEITGASLIGGVKFSINTIDNSYLVVGKDRFNGLKYVLLFNKLETKMKNDKLDYYFNLEDV